MRKSLHIGRVWKPALWQLMPTWWQRPRNFPRWRIGLWSTVWTKWCSSVWRMTGSSTRWSSLTRRSWSMTFCMKTRPRRQLLFPLLIVCAFPDQRIWSLLAFWFPCVALCFCVTCFIEDYPCQSGAVAILSRSRSLSYFAFPCLLDQMVWTLFFFWFPCIALCLGVTCLIEEYQCQSDSLLRLDCRLGNMHGNRPTQPCCLFTIPLILSVEVGTLICVWLYSEEPNTHSPCGSN